MDRKLLGSQILSARPGGDKPEGSDPESQIQELQKMIRPQELGKNLRVPMMRWGTCVQNKAYWPAINRSITEERR